MRFLEKIIERSLGEFSRKQHELSMSYVYKKFHTERFLRQATENNAIFFNDYERYFENNLDIFKNYVQEHSIDVQKCVFLEFGVYKGYSINFMSSRCQNFQFYGFDSFAGFLNVSKTSTWFGFQKRFKNQEIPEVNKNVTLIKGFIENTLKEFNDRHRTENTELFFIHLDADVYEPTKIILDWVAKQHKNKKFFLMFDELINYDEFLLHEYRAFLESIISNGINYKIVSLCNRKENNRFGAFGKVFIELIT